MKKQANGCGVWLLLMSLGAMIGGTAGANEFDTSTYRAGVEDGKASAAEATINIEANSRRIVAAALEIRMRPEMTSQANQDEIALQWQADLGEFVWCRYIGTGGDNAPPEEGLLAEAWDASVVSDPVFMLDLADLPLVGGGSMSLLGELDARRALDVAVKQNTMVDYMALHIEWATDVALKQ